MDLRTQTSVFCGALALAIAASVLLRRKPGRAQWLFAAFAVDVGLWYLAQWLYLEERDAVWARFTALLAVLMPQFALHLFEALLPGPKRSLLLRVAGALLVLMLLLVLSPRLDHAVVRPLVLLYVFGLFSAGLWALLRRGERSRSRATQRRVRFLVGCGTLAATFSLADFLWFVGAPLPPVGAVLNIVFLFVLAESLVRARLVDLYDMASLALVATALAFILAGVFYLCVVLLGGFQTMYLNAVLGGIITLTLFEPLRDRLGAYIRRAIFFERAALERAVARARTELAHVLDVEAAVTVVLSALEDSRRANAAALYVRDSLGAHLELAGAFGVNVPRRLETARLRTLLDALESSRVIDLGALERQLGQRSGATHKPPSRLELSLGAAEHLGELRRAVCVAVPGRDQDIVGLLLVLDDRLEDAFSPDDSSLLESLGLHVATVVENSRQHTRLEERTRLAALGQMAAGLAHEIRNPLGAIKGAAQLLAEAGRKERASDEFVSIILEEVERLDRVVGSVLDYARPVSIQLDTIDLNAIVERTLSSCRSSSEFDTRFESRLESPAMWVRADAERLHQVLINLLRNAAEAMSGGGVVLVETRSRGERSARFVEVSVGDRGPGISEQVRQHLFVPFFTTKTAGTGLGLAISERIAQAMGGRIEVDSQPGEGATFTLVFPAADEPVRVPAATFAVPSLGAG